VEHYDRHSYKTMSTYEYSSRKRKSGPSSGTRKRETIWFKARYLIARKALEAAAWLERPRKAS
jgi:hypothetical protein